ncbi:MAG: phage holin family protein [Bacteroidia bacterium]
MDFIISLVINAVIVLIAAYILPKVEVRNFGSALLVAFLIGIFNWLIGWLLGGVLHIATLGLFALLGLGFIIKVIVSAIIIKIVDAVVPGFKVHGFTNALILAIIIAAISALADYFMGADEDTALLIGNSIKAFLA